MRKVIYLLMVLFSVMVPCSTFAYLNMELTQGVAGAIPIAIVPFKMEGAAPKQSISAVITTDLRNSGRFKVYSQGVLTEFPSRAKEVSTSYFRHLGADSVVIGNVDKLGSDRYRVNFQLVDVLRDQNQKNVLLNHSFIVSGSELRDLAHHISDMVYQQITGVRGIFSTKLAYVVVQHPEGAPPRYVLEVSDQDGYDPRPLLNSPEPIMSPAWSPNARRIAYVSFENHRAGIYVQDIATGARQLISNFPGINGAPAWSPDGKKLALVLSKSGSPNIYLLDVATHRLTQLTHDFYINTEPSWSPDGRSLLFTSNRDGGPQIYQINFITNVISRISYNGDYNARASYTHDGNHIVMLHRASGTYNIAILDLDTGMVHLLSNASTDSDSPSVAPNGTMVLYDTVYGGRNSLAMVSSDGRVRLMLPSRNGEAQDPAWSPFRA